MRIRIAPTLTASVLAVLLLAGCTGSPSPESTETDFTLGGAAGGGTSGDSESGDSPAAASPIDAAVTDDGMPALDITGCEQLDTYEYTPTAGNTTWFFSWTCADRAAYDQTVAQLVTEGYSADPTVISTEGFISERTYMQADANGGSTEAQVNLEGYEGELTFEVFVTLTLP